MIPDPPGYKEAWRALRFRCARGVKHFSQRRNVYAAGAMFIRINDSKTKANFFFNHGITKYGAPTGLMKMSKPQTSLNEFAQK
jgi:hypothetical protein